MKVKKNDFYSHTLNKLFDPNLGSALKGDRFMEYSIEMQKLFRNGDIDLKEFMEKTEFKKDIKIFDLEGMNLEINRFSGYAMANLSGAETKCFIDIHPARMQNIFYVSVMIVNTGYLINGVYKI